MMKHEFDVGGVGRRASSKTIEEARKTLQQGQPANPSTIDRLTRMYEAGKIDLATFQKALDGLNLKKGGMTGYG